MTTLYMPELIEQEKVIDEYLNTLKAIRLGLFDASDLYDGAEVEEMTPEEVMFEYLTDMGPTLKINEGYGFRCVLAYTNAGDTAWVDTVDGTVTCQWAVGLSKRIDDETLGFIIEVLRFRLGSSW